MVFSDQFIEILDALGDKIGITIDWTSSNVLPYLQDLMKRFVKYETYTSILWLILGLVVFIMFAFIIFKKYQKSIETDSTLFALSIVISILLFMFPVRQLIDIIEVNTIPEKTIMRYIKNMNE